MLKNPKKREHDKVFYEKLNLSMSKVKSLVGKFYSLIKNFIKKIRLVRAPVAYATGFSFAGRA